MKSKDVEFRKTADGQAHVYYRGPSGRILPLLDRTGNLYDLRPETRRLNLTDLNSLVQRITAVCALPA